MNTAEGGSEIDQVADWRRRLEFQSAIVLLRMLGAGDQTVTSEIKRACVALLCERDGGKPQSAVPTVATPPLATPGVPRTSDDPALKESQPSGKRFDIRIAEGAVLKGLTAAQLVKGLHERWLTGSDLLLTNNGEKRLSVAFAHVEKLQPFLHVPTFGGRCGAWAAKLVFLAAVYWAINGPLAGSDEIPRDAAPDVALGICAWLLLSFLTARVPIFGLLVSWGGIAVVVAMNKVPLSDLAYSLLTHPVTVLWVLGSTFLAWIVAAFIGSYLNEVFPIKVERKPLPDDLLPMLEGKLPD